MTMHMHRLLSKINFPNSIFKYYMHNECKQAALFRHSFPMPANSGTTFSAPFQRIRWIEQSTANVGRFVLFIGRCCV